MYLIDTTLRDGEQAPGVAFTTHKKMQVAEMLDMLGVDEVEAGTPAIGIQEQEAIAQISRAGFSFKTSCWSRAKKVDILQAAKLGSHCINISLPVSDIQINTLGKNKVWVIKQLKQTIRYAKQHFGFVTMGAQDTTRANTSFLNEFIFYAIDAGANRIRLSDTVGCADPLEVSGLIKAVKMQFPNVEVEFHAHNDLGMATANAITAYKAGASCVSATICGIGERAGNAVLEEIIAYAHTRGVQKYNTYKLKEASALVKLLANTNLDDKTPVTGKNAFRHESGVHTNALLKDPKTYQYLNPYEFGFKMELCFGKHSGKAAIINVLEKNGVWAVDAVLNLCLDRLKQLSFNENAINEQAILDIYNWADNYCNTVKSCFCATNKPELRENIC